MFLHVCMIADYKHDPMRVLASLKVQTNALQDAVCASRARHVILRAARRIGKSYALEDGSFAKIYVLKDIVKMQMQI